MTGLSGVKSESKSRSESPWGCSVAGRRRKRSTTFTNRSFKSWKCSFRIATAARDSIGAMGYGIRHGQVLKMFLLVRDNDIDVIAGPEAMIRDAKQAVCIRRQVNAHHIGPFVGDHVKKSRILVRKSVMILPPHQRSDEKVDRRHGGTPGKLILRLLQPFRVLVEHGIDDMDEGFITGEETVSASENIPLKPAFECVLAEHLHDASGDVQLATVGVFGLVFSQPGFLGSGINGCELVGCGLVWAKNAEGVHVATHHFSKKVSEHPGRRTIGRTRRLYLYGIIAKVRKCKFFTEQAAICMRVGRDAMRPRRCKFL